MNLKNIISDISKISGSGRNRLVFTTKSGTQYSCELNEQIFLESSGTIQITKREGEISTYILISLKEIESVYYSEIKE